MANDKTTRDDDYAPRDKTRVRGGWKDERTAARKRKDVKRGEYRGAKMHRATQN